MTERMKITDVALVYELWNEFAAAVTAGAMGRWIALWMNDGIQMPPGAPRRVGKEQIRAEMQPVFDLFITDMTVNPDEVCVLGEQAYSHGTCAFTMTPREGGDTAEISGKFLTIMEKQVDGSWKIAIDCFNYDAPPG